MAHSEEVNLNSLSLVRGELVIEVESTAAKLEQFVADHDKPELLQACVEGIERISGTLSLIQLRGADLLAEELLSLARDIAPGQTDKITKQLEVLSSGFFILPRYLEYVQQTRRGIPALLIPYVNELRQARDDVPLPESHFFSVDMSACAPLLGRPSAVLGEDVPALVRRLRHMYQVGLLNMLQEKGVKQALGLMQRALERLDVVSGDKSIGKLWWAASIAIESLRANDIALTKSRKQILMVLDRQIKMLQSGASAFDRPAPDFLLKSLIYLTALGAQQSDRGRELQRVFNYPPLSYSDRELEREKEALKGPSANTVASMAAVLKDELRSTKDILERAALGGVDIISDFDDLIETLTKVADILSVIGLTSASTTLKQEVVKIERWREAGCAGDAKELLDTADVLLYVDSSISGLEKQHLSDDQLAKANSITRAEVIASNQLAEAEMVVIQEAESGLALVKRALTSFAESHYDRGHIKNVTATLTGVRGGLTVLGLNRAAKVISACVAFIDTSLMQSDHPAALQHMLETFADAVIGLEYYLDSVKNDKLADDNILQIAEESLDALGYRV